MREMISAPYMCPTQGTDPGGLVQNQLKLREDLFVTSDFSRVLLIPRALCFATKEWEMLGP